jgi:glycosyltransferase involved in cell wall biosynthesis
MVRGTQSYILCCAPGSTQGPKNPNSGLETFVCPGSSSGGGLKSYAQELGVANKVLFVGYQANPMPFVKAARVSVLSSEFEAFGLVVVEAMAVGTPVIATDCPWGPGEIIGANNDYGILVPVGDEAAMAEALERILNDDDLYAHYSNVGLQRAQNYSYSVLRQAWSVVLDPDLALD